MPRKPIDYSNTFIYQLVCKNPNVIETYIGHTANMINRKYAHKQSCTNESMNSYNCRVYQYIRLNGGWDNWNMIMVEKFSCIDAHEAMAKEQSYIISLHSTLNSNLPIGTRKEWVENNQESLIAYRKQYRIDNKEKISKYYKLRYAKIKLNKFN